METGIGPEMDMGTKEILSQIDAAAARGSDVFFLDASWYCPPDKTENDWLYYVGDWFPETERYDMTMAEIRDYCKGKGLKFGSGWSRSGWAGIPGSSRSTRNTAPTATTTRSRAASAEAAACWT